MQTTRMKSQKLELIETKAAEEAARSLRCRFGGSTDAPITNEMMKAAAWFYANAANPLTYRQKLLAALGLHLVENAMGMPIIERVES